MRTVNLNAAYFPAVELLSTVATAVILIYGGNRVMDGQVSIGVLVSFVFYLQSFFDPIQSLSQLYTTYQAGMAALDKIFELLDEEPDIRDRPDALELPRLRGEIEFDDVTFAYGDGEPALCDVSLHVPPGPDAWRSWAPPAPASPRSPSSWRASTTRTTAACSWTATTCAR